MRGALCSAGERVGLEQVVLVGKTEANAILVELFGFLGGNPERPIIPKNEKEGPHDQIAHF
jgi:hypothetical protein